MTESDPKQPLTVYANCQMGLNQSIRADVEEFAKMIREAGVKPD